MNTNQANDFPENNSYLIFKESRLSEAGSTLLELLEYSRDEIINRDIYEVFTSLLRIHQDKLNQLFEQGNIECYIFTKSLEVRDVRISLSIDPETKNSTFTIIEKMDSRVENNTMFIKQLLKDNVIGVAIHSIPELYLLSANQKYIDFQEYPFDKLENCLGKPFKERVNGFEGSKAEEVFLEIIRTGNSFYPKEFEFEHFKRGVTFWDSSIVPIFIDGKAKYIIETVSEVTERVMDRRKKEELEDALQKSHSNLLVAQSIACMGSWEWDLRTREVIWSDEMYRIFGIDKNSIKGRLGDAISRVLHPDDLQVFELANNCAITNKTPFEYRIILPDGSIRYIRAKTGDIIFDELKRPVYLIGIVQDITEQRLTQLALIESEKKKNESLKREIELKDEFLTLISHEFKTPLTVINSAIQTMEVVCMNELSEKAKGFLYKIRQNSNRQLKLVNNLIDITRINAGQIKVNLKNFDIVNLTRQIIESIVIYADQKNIKLSFSSKIQKKVIGIDDEKYERIILNLLSNAIKYTPRGKSVSVTVSQKVIQGKCKICIRIKDEGVGIPADKKDLIFERFGQANSSLTRQAEGTGIGLYLVKILLQLLNGDIKLESQESIGSTFTILLPSEKVSETETEQKIKEVNDSRLIQAMITEFSDVYI